MEFDDWGPVFAQNFRQHQTNQQAVAKALSIALMGDDVDWRQHMTHAKEFIDAMAKSAPKIPAQMRELYSHVPL